MSSASYPISRLLAELITQYGPSETEFVRRLGYRNIDHGLRRLRLWTETASGYGQILKQFASAFPEHAESVNAAIAATERIRQRECDAAFLDDCKAEAGRFLAFVFARGEYRIPAQITLHGLTGGRLELVHVPREIFELPLRAQLESLPKYMREYGSRYRGAVPFFGKLTGFVYARLLDHSRLIAKECSSNKLINRFDGVIRWSNFAES